MEWLLLADYGRNPGGSATATWTKSITQASPQALFRCIQFKDCKSKSLTLKYFFHLWKHYIKQSRVQWLTLLLDMLDFSSPLLTHNNGKLHKARKWDQNKVQINFHIKGLAQLFLQQASNDIFSPVTRLRLQAFSGNLGRLSILSGKHNLFFVFLCQKEIAVIILISEELDVIFSLKRTEIIQKETCFHFTQRVSLYHRQVTYNLSTRTATNYLIHWPILSIYQLDHTPTFKISYKIKSLLLCLRFPDRLIQSGDNKFQRNCATA